MSSIIMALQKLLRLRLSAGDGDEEYSVETRDASPAHLLTQIDSLSMLLKHNIHTLQSTEFEVGGYKWKVRINLDEDDHICVYLCMVGTSSLPAGWEVNAIFTFFLYNHISDNYRCFRGKARRFHAINSNWGFSKLMSKESLTEACNGYLFQDKCVFGAEVFVIKKQPLIEKVSMLNVSNPYKHEWKISEFSKMEEIWKSEEFFAGGYNWNIVMYPKGDEEAYGRYISIYLKCVDSKCFSDGKKVYAACLFCFRNMHKLIEENEDHSYTARARGWFASSRQKMGFDEFKEIDDMVEFVVDDCFILEIQLTVLAVQEEALTSETNTKTKINMDV